jgi:hypothetical protein
LCAFASFVAGRIVFFLTILLSSTIQNLARRHHATNRVNAASLFFFFGYVKKQKQKKRKKEKERERIEPENKQKKEKGYKRRRTCLITPQTESTPLRCFSPSVT